MNTEIFFKIVKEFNSVDINATLDIFDSDKLDYIPVHSYKKFIGKLIDLDEQRQASHKLPRKKNIIGTAVTHSIRLAEAELQLRIDHLTELKKQQQDFLEMLFINSTDQKNAWVGISEMQNEVSSLYREFPDTERPANNKPTANEEEY